MKKKILMILGGMIFMTAITRCRSNESREEIEARFEGFGSLYPTSNLMDFYDKEGNRGDSFDENDKGTWIINTSIRREDNGVLNSEGMILHFDRNDRKAIGDYYMRTISEKNVVTELRYSVYYDEKGIHLVEGIEDQETADKIVNFKFLVQYVSLESNYLSSLPLLDKIYNFEVPLYDLMYQLTNDDDNIRKIKEQYKITRIFEGEPRLHLEGTGGSDWGLNNRRTVRFIFDEKRSISIGEGISFVQSQGMR